LFHTPVKSFHSDSSILNHYSYCNIYLPQPLSKKGDKPIQKHRNKHSPQNSKHHISTTSEKNR
jgi:hypothetical protein